jgi:hypothetical protein
MYAQIMRFEHWGLYRRIKAPCKRVSDGSQEHQNDPAGCCWGGSRSKQVNDAASGPACAPSRASSSPSSGGSSTGTYYVERYGGKRRSMPQDGDQSTGAWRLCSGPLLSHRCQLRRVVPPIPLIAIWTDGNEWQCPSALCVVFFFFF